MPPLASSPPRLAPAVGTAEGDALGRPVGEIEGEALGRAEGLAEGLALGAAGDKLLDFASHPRPFKLLNGNFDYPFLTKMSETIVQVMKYLVPITFRDQPNRALQMA